MRIPEILHQERVRASGTDTFRGTFPAGEATAAVVSIDPVHRVLPGRIMNTFDVQVQVYVRGETLGTFPVHVRNEFGFDETQQGPERTVVQAHDVRATVTANFSPTRTEMTLSAVIDMTLIVAKERTLKVLIADGEQ